MRANIRRNLLLGLPLILTVLLLDQATKLMVHQALHLGESIRVFDDFLRITYIRNPNSAFGISLGDRFPYEWVSGGIALVLTLFLFLERQPGMVFVYSLLIGGALGNLIDRLRMGEVIDWIDVGLSPTLRWPVFNVADSAVTIGILILLALSLFGRKSPASAEKEVKVYEKDHAPVDPPPGERSDRGRPGD